MIKQLFIFFLFSLFLNGSFAQAPKDNFTHYTELDGLPSNQVFEIYQDRFGFIWAGTLNGLTRYDGYEFQNYFQDIQDPNSLQIDVVYSVYEDSDNELWVGGIGMISKYNRDTDNFTNYSFSEFQVDSLIITLTVFTIQEDKNGNLIIGLGPYDVGNAGDGLLIFNKETHTFSKYDFAVQTSTDNIHGSVRSRNNQLYFVGDFGLIKLDEDLKKAEFLRPEAYNNERDFHAFALSEDASGLLWIGTLNCGLFSFNPQTNSFKQFLPEEKTGQIHNIYVEDDQTLWLATDKGLLYYNPKNNLFFTYQKNINNPYSINSTQINTILKDAAGSFWIGTWDAGINRLDQTGSVFRAYVNNPMDDSSYAGNWANGFAESADGDIWINIGLNFLNKFDRRNNTFSRISPNGNNNIRTCFNDINNDLWVSTFGGDLFKYDFHQKTFKKILTIPSDWGNTVTSILTDSFGNMWLGSFERYFMYNSKTAELIHYDYGSEPASGSGDVVVKFVEDQNQNIWICTDDGLFRRNLKSGDIKRIGLSNDPGKSFLNQDINSIYIGEDGIIWVGTWRGGLNSYNPVTENIKTYTRQNGLPSNSIQGILGDEKNGAIWVSTFQGISRFDLKTETFQNFDIKDGIQSNLFADGSALKTRNGDFIFGGSGGFTLFRPEGINESKVPPSVFLTGLKLSDKTILPGDSPLKTSIYDAKEIVLEHDQNDLTIEYLGIHFVKSSGTHYAYILENYEDDWHNVGNSRKAIYPNLPPGEYTFRVRAANYNDVWNEQGASLAIIINPPLWATWWAYTVYAFLLFGLLFSLRKFELNRQNKNAEVKESKLRAQAAELQAKAAEAQSKVVQAENERKSKELEEARQLQLSMLPKELPQLPNLDIAVYMQTATEVGGDYYDFHVALDGTLTVVIGDATGHGMKAGTMVTTAKSLFRSYGSNPDILFSFQEFSRCIKEMNFGRLSMCLSMLKISDHTLQISSAAMPPAYIYRGDSKKVEEFQFEAMPLGAIEKFPYQVKETKLNPGDTILLMSDGLPELKNSNDEMYGYNKIHKGFGEVAENQPEAIISFLKSESGSWIDNNDPDDDVTFVVIKVK